MHRDVLDELDGEVRSLRRHYRAIVSVLAVLTIGTLAIIQYSLSVQQLATRLGALGAEQSNLLSRLNDLGYALKRKATEASAGLDMLDVIRGEIHEAGSRALAINGEVLALDADTWFGIPIGGSANGFFLDEPYQLKSRVEEFVSSHTTLTQFDREGLIDQYESFNSDGGPLVRKTPVMVGLEAALAAFQQEAVDLNVKLGRVQGVLSGMMILLLVFDGLLIFRPLVKRLMESKKLVSESQVVLDRMAYQDSLTGLANRARFGTALADAISRSNQTGQRLAVLQLDLNRFKSINDTLGHAAGDAVIAAVGHRLAACVRENDLVARLGGDEFAVICPDIADMTVVTGITDRIRARVAEPLTWGSEILHPSTSIGCALYPDHGRDGSALLIHADAALYVAKGKADHVHVYDDAMLQSDRLTRQLEHELPDALISGEIDVYYQPQHRTTDRAVVGLEAFVRWHHPDLGLLLPNDFLPKVGRGAQLAALTRHVVEQVAIDLEAWWAAGLDVGRVTIKAPRQVLLGSFLVDLVAEQFEPRGLPYGALTAAIPENALMDRGGDRIRETIMDLAAKGVTIAVDSFGGDLAPVSHLRLLPVGEIKLDRSLSSTAATDPRSAAVIRGLVEIGRAMDVRVLASGVESMSELAALTAIGCDVMQGWLLGQPMPAEEIMLFVGGERPNPSERRDEIVLAS
ncbi:putative bifunctional diguanylate cyclase/phosphodiesterase [Chthonobacter albigriseus]|uniref:putative bifunctional diguanylate cyclase/phosphodiesterase n=1 Tax=Chthonobacter albigriseus TaxID=1683161 RepID=UPI0015EE6EEF|nr:EAL domain-containing protein [Chthonobacter albigriseus]